MITDPSLSKRVNSSSRHVLEKIAVSLALLLMVATGCGDDDEQACEADAYQCTDEEILQQCDDDASWADVEDCAAQGLMCHAEMGHCMAE